MHTGQLASKTDLPAQMEVEEQRWGTVGLCFPTFDDETCQWLFGSALIC